uniref:OSIGBa0153E02-OSIGBa0093I20.11 protein n=1 Tax=Oryza sativa TaxID=4530 RepID=Q01HR4_ORYSA|nr:OSIGBa0153E02-OSIGBa0093I20.11 [Oryza sativa]
MAGWGSGRGGDDGVQGGLGKRRRQGGLGQRRRRRWRRPGRAGEAAAAATAVSRPIYLLTASKVTKESLKQLDKQRHRFLWAGTGDITGGKCKVNWTKTCLPTSQGGLGVLNLEKFTRALRLRWLWHEWKDPNKPWVGLDTPCDEIDKDLFAASTKITVGDGNMTRFWDSTWIDGRRPKDLMPLVYAISKNRKKSLHQGKEDDTWVDDLIFDAGSTITVNLVEQLVRLWEAVRNVQLVSEEPDQIVWKFTGNGHYTASSAYHAQCLEAPSTNLNSLIWKAWAPGKCKFYVWLIIQNRVWTSDRLAIRGWQNNGHCPLCRCEAETGLHLVATCRYTKRIWHHVAGWVGYHQLEPSQWEEAHSVCQWWESLANTPNIPKKGLRSLILLVVWEIWKERNRRIFDNKEMAVGLLLAKIKEEASVWALAGAKRLRDFVPRIV